MNFIPIYSYRMDAPNVMPSTSRCNSFIALMEAAQGIEATKEVGWWIYGADAYLQFSQNPGVESTINVSLRLRFYYYRGLVQYWVATKGFFEYKRPRMVISASHRHVDKSKMPIAVNKCWCKLVPHNFKEITTSVDEAMAGYIDSLGH